MRKSMTRAARRIIILASLVAGATSLAVAHHSYSAFDMTGEKTVTGTIKKFDYTNPHSWIYMDVKGPDGKVTTWMVEGGSPNALLRLGFTRDSLPAGTEIMVEGFQSKDGSNRAVGTKLTFADGKKLFMGGSAPGANP